MKTTTTENVTNHGGTFTVNSLAEYLCVEPQTIRVWRKRRLLPAPTSFGKTARWRRDKIDAFMTKHESTPTVKEVGV